MQVDIIRTRFPEMHSMASGKLFVTSFGRRRSAAVPIIKKSDYNLKVPRCTRKQAEKETHSARQTDGWMDGRKNERNEHIDTLTDWEIN